MKIPAINRDSKLAFYIGDLDYIGRLSIIHILCSVPYQSIFLKDNSTWISLNFNGKLGHLGQSSSTFKEGLSLYDECKIIKIYPK